ncbi:sodium/hydrogen exchanger [Chloropicon primus]|uniref:Sodium/hydrogen exchanger n=1 Tax=Chloropicon primus TaxID=1764295 RepID=A0A5B8MUK0_9CHLO|nr:sodium/hydrogen exchanger [Chloropicon primus]|eukprot:QDZ24468.1 sodium/hydrogen exchanger [Chloropicon primus]
MEGGPEAPTELELESNQIYFLVLILLLLICFIGSDCATRRLWFLTEGSFATLVGLVGGVGFLLVSVFGKKEFRSLKIMFDSEVFLDILLPPIIFQQGFSMHKQRFFKQMGGILSFGLLGTILSFAVISVMISVLSVFSTRTCLKLGAIMAATDSVAVLQVLSQKRTPLLHSLVFGEGVVNDASSIVLLRSIKSAYKQVKMDDALSSTVYHIFFSFFVTFTLSSLVGISVGLFSALLMRLRAVSNSYRERLDDEATPTWLQRSASMRGIHLDFLANLTATHQVILLGLLAYLAYFSSELLGLSGIMTLFVTGLVMSHYTQHNLDDEAKVTCTNLFHALSLLAEVVIYILVGLDSLYKGNWNNVNKSQVIALVVVLLLAILLARIVFVFPMCYLANLLPGLMQVQKAGQLSRLNFYDMCIIVWAGTLRGAVSVALCLYAFAPDPIKADKEASTVIAAVMALVIFSVIALGAATKPLIQFLDAKRMILVRNASGVVEEDGGLGLSLVRFPSGYESEPPSTPPRSPSAANASHVRRKSWLMKKWDVFDDEVMKPIFGGEMTSRTSHQILEEDSEEETSTARDVCLKSENH